jgi:DNA-binding MarR family transcriptional regulator
VADLSPLAAERFVVDIAVYERIAATTLAEVAKPRGPSGRAEFLALCLLHVDGPQRPAALGRLTGLTSGGVSKMLDRLERAGVVRRRGPIADDLRAVAVAITPKGARFVTRISGAIAEQLADTPVLRRFTATLRG